MDNKTNNGKSKILGEESRIIKSSLHLKPKTPLEKQQIIKVNTILTHLLNQSDSIDFREPVDWQAMELIDYPEIVQHPMDLGTITHNLKEKQYKTVQVVLNDIQLVWDNCKMYNPSTSEIYGLADKLEATFRKMIRNYLPNLRVSSITSVPYRQMVEKPFTVVFQPERSNQQQQQQEQQSSRSKRKVSSKYQKNDKNTIDKPIIDKPRSVQKLVPVTIQKKKDFVQKLNNLSTEQLSIIIQRIQVQCPTAFSTLQNDYAYLNVENLNDQCFSRTNEILQNMITNNKPQNSKS